jgi:hypothetical protein
VFFSPLYEPLKQKVVFGRGNRQRPRLSLEEQRRRSFASRLSHGKADKSHRDNREERYTSETQSVHIGLFLDAIGCG